MLLILGHATLDTGAYDRGEVLGLFRCWGPDSPLSSTSHRSSIMYRQSTPWAQYAMAATAAAALVALATVSSPATQLYTVTSPAVRPATMVRTQVPVAPTYAGRFAASQPSTVVCLAVRLVICFSLATLICTPPPTPPG